MDVRVVNTQGAFENMQLLDRGEVELAITQNDVAYNAVQTNLVLGHRNVTARALALLYKEVAQVVVGKGTAIESLRDLRGRKIVLGPPNSGSRFSSELLLNHIGILGQMQPTYTDYEEAADGILNGSVDGLIVWRPVPVPVLQDLFRRDAVNLVSIPPEALATLQQSQPFLVADLIPAGVYAHQAQPASTVAVKAMLVASTSMPASMGRSIVAAVFGNIPELIAHHPKAADLSIRAYRLQDGMSIDLHPGALAFFNTSS